MIFAEVEVIGVIVVLGEEEVEKVADVARVVLFAVEVKETKGAGEEKTEECAETELAALKSGVATEEATAEGEVIIGEESRAGGETAVTGVSLAVEEFSKIQVLVALGLGAIRETIEHPTVIVTVDTMVVGDRGEPKWLSLWNWCLC